MLLEDEELLPSRVLDLRATPILLELGQARCVEGSVMQSACFSRRRGQAKPANMKEKPRTAIAIGSISTYDGEVWTCFRSRISWRADRVLSQPPRCRGCLADWRDRMSVEHWLSQRSWDEGC